MKNVDGDSELPEYQVWPQHKASFRVLFKLGKREYGFSFIDEIGKLDNSPIRSQLIDLIEANNAGMQTCLSPSLRSKKSMHQARSWIQDCDEHHTGCHKQRNFNARLPTRLIHVHRVDRELNAHLCEGDSLPAAGIPYLTLSHCWGQIKFMTLTERNLPEFRKKIPVKELSNTFQDALYVVVELGFEYIWIDSLCIVQDSHLNKDWEKEAKTMSDIYKNAACNLAVEPSPSPSSTPMDVGSLKLAQIHDDVTLEFPDPILREMWDQVVVPISDQNQNPDQVADRIFKPIPYSTLYAGEQTSDVDPPTQLLPQIIHSKRARLWKRVRGLRSRSYANATEVAPVSPVERKQADTSFLETRLETQQEAAVCHVINVEPQQASSTLPEITGKRQDESVVSSNISVEHDRTQSTPPGFLLERQQADLVSPSIRVKWNEGKGQLQQYRGRQFIVSESDPFQETWSGTLSTRGWVLQEQILVFLNLTVYN